MIIALVGSHGTGKTEVFNLIKERRPELQYFTEGVRHQVPAFGYDEPYAIVDDIGIGGFELMNINSWSVIDPSVNTALDPKQDIVTDRSSVDNYAYYLSLKKSKQDLAAEKLIKGMAKHYASLVDIFVYFPTGVFPLEGDKMRPSDVRYQLKVDKNILRAFSELGVKRSRIHTLKSANLNDRLEEVLKLIK